MAISVLGTGYLGATHAAALAAAGHEVVGVDRDTDRVASLSTGRAPFREEGLDDALTEGLGSGRLRFTTDLAEAAHADVHFICVGTPETHPTGSDQPSLDLTALWDVAGSLAPYLDRPCTVVGRSTVPVGTAVRVRELLHRQAPAGPGVGVAWNPEFLREGCALADSVTPHRIVVGAERDSDQRVLEKVYADWLGRGVPFVGTDLATAELSKLAANAMLAVRVSTANVLAELCEAAGADVEGLVEIVGGDPRIGRDYLQPGPGYGGSCLPKDIRELARDAAALRLPAAEAFLRQADDVNTWQRQRTARLAVDLLGGDARGRRVAVLGATFKAGSDDLRDSPALIVAQFLAAEGATVVVYDPMAGERVPPPLRVVGSAGAACTGADLVLVLTDWPEFARLDPAGLARVVRSRQVVDTRRVLDRGRWEQARWEVWALGVDDPGAAARSVRPRPGAQAAPSSEAAQVTPA